MTSITARNHVRAVGCDHDASDDEVYDALRRATEPLTEAWARLTAAKRIGIKFNQDKQPQDRARFEGQLQQLVSEKVGRACLRLLRERTDAELIAIDVSFYVAYSGARVEETTTFSPMFREFDVDYVDGTMGPFETVPVPSGGVMFDQYLLPTAAVEVDEIVSVAKLKSHAFMGFTLSLKNLFGLMPTEPAGHPRSYYHHLVRMPYMLADLGRILDPALCIIDGLIGQTGREWGTGRHGDGAQISRTLVAGDHAVATDACAATLMGHDPCGDWPSEPFHRDRNALLVAADEAGYGCVDVGAVDFQSEVDAPIGDFYSSITDPPARVLRWRRSTCEQALGYRDDKQRYVDAYAGKYILLQAGDVVWHSPEGRLRKSRRELAGNRPDEAMWLKYVDPEELDGEHYEVYERTLFALGEAPRCDR